MRDHNGAGIREACIARRLFVVGPGARPDPVACRSGELLEEDGLADVARTLVRGVPRVRVFDMVEGACKAARGRGSVRGECLDLRWQRGDLSSICVMRMDVNSCRSVPKFVQLNVASKEASNSSYSTESFVEKVSTSST